MELHSLSAGMSSCGDRVDRGPADPAAPGAVPPRVAASAVHSYGLPPGVRPPSPSSSEAGLHAPPSESEEKTPLSVPRCEVAPTDGPSSSRPGTRVVSTHEAGPLESGSSGSRLTRERRQQSSSSPDSDPISASAAPRCGGPAAACPEVSRRNEVEAGDLGRGLDFTAKDVCRLDSRARASLRAEGEPTAAGDSEVDDGLDPGLNGEVQSARGQQQHSGGRRISSCRLQMHLQPTAELGCERGSAPGSAPELTGGRSWQRQESGGQGEGAAAQDYTLPQRPSFLRDSGFHGAELRKPALSRATRGDDSADRRAFSASCPLSQLGHPRLPAQRGVQATSGSASRQESFFPLSSSSEVLPCSSGGEEAVALRQNRCFHTSAFVMASPPFCRTPPSGGTGTPPRAVHHGRPPLQQAPVGLRHQTSPRSARILRRSASSDARQEAPAASQAERVEASASGGASLGSPETGDRLVEEDNTEGHESRRLSQKSPHQKSDRVGAGARRRRSGSEPPNSSPKLECRRLRGEAGASLSGTRSAGEGTSRTPDGGEKLQATSAAPMPAGGKAAGGGACCEVSREAAGQPYQSSSQKALPLSMQTGDSLPGHRKPAQADFERRLSDASSRLPYANTICSFYNRTLE